MSYDIWLEIDAGGAEPVSVFDVGNYTGNVSPMWYKALGFSLGDLHGKLAGDCIEVLERALAHMKDPANLDEYLAMNPPNGWGNYEGAFGYLATLLEGCRICPKATIHIWR
jgi:hypothetical protein